MKALTIAPPYAHLILAGRKTIESRSWSTQHRGPLAIHAAIAWPPHGRELAVEAGYSPERMETGAVLGQVILIDVIPVEGFRLHVGDEDRRFGDFSDGRFAWLLAEPDLYPTPDYIRGAQGLWDYTRRVSPLRGPDGAGGPAWRCVRCGREVPGPVSPTLVEGLGSATCLTHGRVTVRYSEEVTA